jgi:hypothetical protein
MKDIFKIMSSTGRGFIDGEVEQLIKEIL